MKGKFITFEGGDGAGKSLQMKKFAEYLEAKGIETVIHYPIPPHLAECYEYLGTTREKLPQAEYLANNVLSLPMFNGMGIQEVTYVIKVINEFE